MTLFSLNVCASEYSAHINTESLAQGKVSVHSNDMDGDGDMDVVEANSHSIVWQETLDNGSMEKHVIGTAKNPSSVFSTDLDNDGDADILCTVSDKELGWYENDGESSPSFSYHAIDRSTFRLNYLRSSDMDKDGDQDVVTCQAGGSRIIWYENNGNGKFKSHYLFAENPKCDFVASDMDRDGNLDFVSCKQNRVTDNCEITWHRNNGGHSPKLSSYVIIKETQQINSFYCADLDQDDDMDIIAGLSSNEILWYENNGNGFTRNTISTDTDLILNLYPEDVNHDGALDIVCKLRQGRFILFENTNKSTPEFVRKDMTASSLFAASQI
jgi:hypothetical protein